MQSIKKLLANRERDILLFFAATIFLGITSGIFETTYNNYLNDVFSVTEDVRGFLEFPRELPGFLVALLSGALLFLPVTRMGALSALSVGLGVVGLAFFSGSFGMMVLWTTVWSTGSHLLMPVNDTIGLGLSDKASAGSMLGRVGSFSNFAQMAGCVLVWLGFTKLDLSYSSTFLIAGITAVAACIAFRFILLKSAPREKTKTRIILKKDYSVFYWLNVLFGARKQVFITFGPWVIIKVFDMPPQKIAELWIYSSIIGIFFKPILGMLIDKIGEKGVLIAESVLLIGVCAGYGLAPVNGWGKYLVFVCYVSDLVLAGVGIARTTYLSKIAVSPDDLTPTLSMGVSINHIVSMLLPSLGGWVWKHYGYSWVFVGAALIAVINVFVAGFMMKSYSKKQRFDRLD